MPKWSGIPGVDLYVYEALSYNYICFNMRQRALPIRLCVKPSPTVLTARPM